MQLPAQAGSPIAKPITGGKLRWRTSERVNLGRARYWAL